MADIESQVVVPMTQLVVPMLASRRHFWRAFLTDKIQFSQRQRGTTTAIQINRTRKPHTMTTELTKSVISKLTKNEDVGDVQPLLQVSLPRFQTFTFRRP